MSNCIKVENLTVEDLIIIKDTLWKTQSYDTNYTKDSRLRIHTKLVDAFKKAGVKITRKKGNNGS